MSTFVAEYVLMRCGQLGYGARKLQACVHLACRADWTTGKGAHFNPSTVAEMMSAGRSGRIRRQDVLVWWKQAREDGIFVANGDERGLIVHDVVAPAEGFERALASARGEAREVGRARRKEERAAYKERKREQETHVEAQGGEAQIHASPPDAGEGRESARGEGHESMPLRGAQIRAPEVAPNSPEEHHSHTDAYVGTDAGGAARDDDDGEVVVTESERERIRREEAEAIEAMWDECEDTHPLPSVPDDEAAEIEQTEEEDEGAEVIELGDALTEKVLLRRHWVEVRAQRAAHRKAAFTPMLNAALEAVLDECGGDLGDASEVVASVARDPARDVGDLVPAAKAQQERRARLRGAA